MKLRNKITGEVVKANIATMPDGSIKLQATAEKGGLHTIFYDSLEKLKEDWKDYKEPKEYWYIFGCTVMDDRDDGLVVDKDRKEIGNYFETKEEVEKTVEKLKAWKRLKDKGFKWRYYAIGDEGQFRAYFSIKDGVDIGADLDLLFGGEK